ncbi:MAG: hypothetical protein WCE79_14710 [Xanthobacteraceae bacterium]
MDAPTATIIAAVIAGICSIIVALISTSGRGSKKRGPKKRNQQLSDALFGGLSKTRVTAFSLTFGMGLGLLASSLTLFIAGRDFSLGGFVLLVPNLVIIGILFGVAYVIQRRRLPQSN